MLNIASIRPEFLDCLSQRERQVIELRQSRTLQEIGDVLGVCRERIRQIEKRALRKLRHPARVKKLSPLAREIFKEGRSNEQ